MDDNIFLIIQQCQSQSWQKQKRKFNGTASSTENILELSISNLELKEIEGRDMGSLMQILF